MSTQIDTAERNRLSVRRWYAAHREQYSELRRLRYRKDPKLRAKARKASAKYRRDRQKGLIAVTRTLTREVGGKEVEVYTSGYVADKIGYSPQVLRGWEQRGWLPSPIFPDEKHRLYTARQVGLIKLLADVVKPKRGRRAPEDPMLHDVIDMINKTWKVVDDGGKKAAKKGRNSPRRGKASASRR